MGKIKTIECKNWLDFKSEIGKLFNTRPFQRGIYLFRGHGSKEWPLISSFDRWFKGEKIDKPKTFNELFELFKKQTEGMKIDSHILEDENSFLAMAQHYSLPTRLLDWSESPYIASFFAFCNIILNENIDTHVAIWCLNSQNPIWDEEFGCTIIDVPAYGNERIKNQLGKFTILKAPYDTIEEYVNDFDSPGDALFRYIVPTKEVKTVLSDLDIMGINFSKIYPGIEGCAKSAGLRILFKQLPDK